MRLLITGGSGCLGSAIAREFITQTEALVVVDNFSTGNRNWLPAQDNLTVIDADVRDSEAIRNIFENHRPTHVVHAAGSYADPNDWVGDLETNALGSLNVSRASEKVGVTHLMYLQTALVYGRPNQSPILPTHPLAPESSYSISKAAGEMYTLGAGVPVTLSLRIANTCAPHLSIGPLPTFYKKILSGESCKISPAVRDFLDVDDFLILVALIFAREEAVAGTYNVSTGKGKTIRELFETMRVELGRSDANFEDMSLQEDDVASVVLDSESTQKQFGWSPSKTFEETVSRQIEWFAEFGVETLRSHLQATPRKER